MEKEIGSVLGTKYWREQFSAWIRHISRRYQNYISRKEGRWLMYLVLALWTPFAILLIPLNFLLNSLTGYYRQKEFNETLTFIKYRDDKAKITEKIQNVLYYPRKRYIKKGKSIAFVCDAESIVWELYQRGFYAEMLPILEELNAIFCKDRYLPKYYTYRLLLVDSYCQCGKTNQAKTLLKEVVDDINTKQSIEYIDCDFSTLCKTVCAVKGIVNDPSFIAAICHSLAEIKELRHYEDNQYFNELLNAKEHYANV